MCTGKQKGGLGKAAQKRGVQWGGENVVISERRKKRLFIQRSIHGPEVVLFNVKGPPHLIGIQKTITFRKMSTGKRIQPLIIR